MPKKSCAKCGLNDVRVGTTYCPQCEEKLKQKQKEYDKQRGSAVSRGYDARWQKIRQLKLLGDPLRERCLPQAVQAVLVHHKDGNPRNNNRDNLESLCNTCHEKHHGNRRI